MATIQQRLGVPAKTPLIEATADHADPFFARPIAVPVLKRDIEEASRKDHEQCAIACAVKNASPDTLAACVQSRMVYLARLYPRMGMNPQLRGKAVISKHQLSKEGVKLVQAFDRNPNRCPKETIEIIPIAPSHTTAARIMARGKGKPHGHGHVQRAAPGKRLSFLRSRIAPRSGA